VLAATQGARGSAHTALTGPEAGDRAARAFPGRKRYVLGRACRVQREVRGQEREVNVAFLCWRLFAKPQKYAILKTTILQKVGLRAVVHFLGVSY